MAVATLARKLAHVNGRVSKSKDRAGVKDDYFTGENLRVLLRGVAELREGRGVEHELVGADSE